MSKLQRAVESQTIQFLALPRIFNSLSADLPSGSVKLPNGEVAYWRLHRNLAELKKNRKGVKDLVVRLAQAFKALVNSDSFLNHYGLTKAPEIATEAQLATVFRNLLSVNTNRVEYAAINHGRQKPLVESINVPLGNLAFFNAYRGIKDLPRVEGIKGKMWLNDSTDADKHFAFTIVSPVVKLTDFISADRLQAEILNKIKSTLPIMAHNPKITFDDGQFGNYVTNGLKELTEKHAGAGANGKQKSKKFANSTLSGTDNVGRANAQARLSAAATAIENGEVAEGATEIKIAVPVVLDKATFDALTDNDQSNYVAAAGMWINSTTFDAKPLIAGFLKSGILETQYAGYNEQAVRKVTHAFYLSMVLGLSVDQFESYLGKREPKYLVTQPTESIVENGVANTESLTSATIDSVDTGGDSEEGFDYAATGSVGDDPEDLPPADAGDDEPGVDGLVEVIMPIQGQSYTVVAGDTLSHLAQKAYGNADWWVDIYNHNDGVIGSNPDLIIPGQVLEIPVLVTAAS